MNTDLLSRELFLSPGDPSVKVTKPALERWAGFDAREGHVSEAKARTHYRVEIGLAAGTAKRVTQPGGQ